MRIYYPNMESLSQQSFQLQDQSCPHCGKSAQLISHGYVYTKLGSRDVDQAVGKRLLCSVRYGRSGCGRTLQLYLDSTIRFLHLSSETLLLFIRLFVAGESIQRAYQAATGREEPRHAYRWLQRLMGRLIDYRDVPELPHFDEHPLPSSRSQNVRRSLITKSFLLLNQRFGSSLCSAFQAERQRTFF